MYTELWRFMLETFINIGYIINEFQWQWTNERIEYEQNSFVRNGKIWKFTVSMKVLNKIGLFLKLSEKLKNKTTI